MVTSINSKQIGSLCVWQPSDTTGVINMAGELEDFIEANPGKRVSVAPGATISLKDFGTTFTSLPTVIDIDFGATIILHDPDFNCVFLDNTGNAGAETAISAITDTYINTNSAATTEIDLGAATISGEAHDFIAVYSTDANPAKSGGQAAEIIQLIQDEASNTLYTAGTLARTSLFTTNMYVRKLDKTHSVRIEGGIWTSDGDADSELVTTRNTCIKILGYVDPIVQGDTHDSPWTHCVWFQATAQAIHRDFIVKDTLNMALTTPSVPGYSYGTIVYGINHATVVTGGITRNCRHPVVTTDGNSGGSATWYNKGYPTSYAFIDNYGFQCYGSVVDSHEEGANGLIDGVYCFNSVREEHEIFTSRAVQSRAYNETIKNVHCYGSSGGISVANTWHGVIDEIVIQNVTLRNIHKYSGTPGVAGTAMSIDLDTMSDAAHNRRVKIQNVTATDIDKFIYCGKNWIIDFDGVHTAGMDVVFDMQAGAVATASNCRFDFSTNAWSGSADICLMRSHATFGGSEFRFLDYPTIVKGASNKPTQVFTEQDLTAAKTVWMFGAYEIDNGYTATIGKEAGHTTLNSATDCNTIAL